MSFRTLALVVTLALSASWVSAGNHQMIHAFTGTTSDGSTPYYGDLVRSGSTLYGMTYAGGESGLGTIFRVDTDGLNFDVIHDFTGSTTDGSQPTGSLTLDGSTLYGMTSFGGLHGIGTIFKIGTDGLGFSVIHDFNGTNDGKWPSGSLTLIGSTLYGMGFRGGSGLHGTVFKVGTNGSGFTVLHPFTRGTNDGGWGYGSLTFDGSDTLYGMTYYGGTSNLGTIFKIDTVDGSGFALLHSFAGGYDDGQSPYGALTLIGSTLYGMTCSGGAASNSNGTIFKIGTGGGDITVLHRFAGGTADGKYPYGSLSLNNTTLYGMTCSGGANNRGTIFKIDTVDGSGYQMFQSLAGQPSDGSTPKGSLLLCDGQYYGMSYYGGTTTDFGTVFTEDFVRTAVARPLPGGGALAVWSVPNEEGFAEYRLQRRGGDGWTTVGSCPAGGGTAGSYALADPNGKEGSTYRLVAVKASGATLADDQAFQAK